MIMCNSDIAALYWLNLILPKCTRVLYIDATLFMHHLHKQFPGKFSSSRIISSTIENEQTNIMCMCIYES